MHARLPASLPHVNFFFLLILTSHDVWSSAPLPFSIFFFLLVSPLSSDLCPSGDWSWSSGGGLIFLGVRKKKSLCPSRLVFFFFFSFWSRPRPLTCPFGDQSWSSGGGSIFLVVRKKNRVTMGVGDDINDMEVGDDYNIFLQFACLRTSQ